MRSAECGIAARPSLRDSTFHLHSAFRIPHSALLGSRRPQLSHHHPLVERLLFRPDYLVGLVPLPREENCVSRMRQLKGAGDGTAAVELAVMRLGAHSDLHVVEYPLRVLR